MWYFGCDIFDVLCFMSDIRSTGGRHVFKDSEGLSRVTFEVAVGLAGGDLNGRKQGLKT